MSILYVVPAFYLRHWRRTSPGQKSDLAPVSIQGLTDRILKEGLVPYKEDSILEEVAIWQAVQENRQSLQFFKPIAYFPGFFAELQWLFRQLDLGEIVLESVPAEGRQELEVLHQAYHKALMDQGILDRAGQLRRALELVAADTYFPEATEVHLWGLSELSPLEERFLRLFAGDRPIKTMQHEIVEPSVTVVRAADPYEEVERIGEAIRAQVKAGVPLERIGLVFPQPRQYLPILHAVFNRQNLPWRMPASSLRNTPLGKTVLILIAGELEGWNKHHLQLLTAPGWGFPFGLTAEEQRRLRLAPSLKGLPAWREYLGKEKRWNAILDFISSVGAIFSECRPIRGYGIWLDKVLVELKPEKWVLPEDDLENWAELVKAWDGMDTLATSLQAYDWQCSGNEFLRLFQALLDNYRIRGPRVFTQQLQVLRVEQLGAYDYDVLYAAGLVEGQFPPRQYTHWLTKKAATVQRDQLYNRLISAASQVLLYYPEVDREGKLNLPSTLLPSQETTEEKSDAVSSGLHYPSLHLGNGLLKDGEILDALQRKIIEEGLSVSKLNEYASCPYKFFCSYVLNLSPPEEESLDVGPLERGIIVHNVLDKFWRRYLKGPIPYLEEAQTEIEGLLRQEYAEFGEKPSIAMISTLRSFIRSDLQLVETGFRPTHLEREFKGLAIETAAGSVEVRGRIDRIDVNPEGAYVLYDYKTGGAPSGPDMIRGEDIQIGAYLLAARGLLPAGQNVGAAYYVISNSRRAGIFHADYHRRLLIRKSATCLPDEKFKEQIEFFEQKLKQMLLAIFAGKFPIEPINTRICSYCPFQAICRKEVHSL